MPVVTNIVTYAKAALTKLARAATANEVVGYSTTLSKMVLPDGTQLSAPPATYGTGVATFLATPTSANLKTAITDETGSAGALVFATSPSIATPTFTGAITAQSAVFQNGLITFLVGANDAQSTLTDATLKAFRVDMPHYLLAQVAVRVLGAFSTSTENVIEYGGNTSTKNTATRHSFYTASTTTTLTGIKRFEITGTGDVVVPGGNLLCTGAGGLGYGTGAGGAVTQITSRTTGVTLNKTAGAITLFAAAGSATWGSFTVTNSTVAAGDTIVLSVKSSTNLYLTQVTAVAAGSFQISFATTGGTASDSPIINFAVVKSVAA